MKYPIYCTSQKLFKTLYMVIAIRVIFVVILVVLFSCKIMYFRKLVTIVLYAMIILDTFYIIDVVLTYKYIFVVYKRQEKLRKISYNGRINHGQFKFTVPTFVVITYVLFKVLPHFCSFSMMIKSLDKFSKYYKISHILYLSGWLANPIIYVCNLYFAKRKHRRS